VKIGASSEGRLCAFISETPSFLFIFVGAEGESDTGGFAVTWAWATSLRIHDNIAAFAFNG
jgi:hypothetical protein